MPSFPRRRESWLDLNNGLFLHSFLNIKQDSRLRGNDGNLTVSGFILGFAKVSECVNLFTHCLVVFNGAW